jgi:hypothetical protein
MGTEESRIYLTGEAKKAYSENFKAIFGEPEWERKRREREERDGRK